MEVSVANWKYYISAKTGQYTCRCHDCMGTSSPRFYLFGETTEEWERAAVRPFGLKGKVKMQAQTGKHRQLGLGFPTWDELDKRCWWHGGFRGGAAVWRSWLIEERDEFGRKCGGLVSRLRRNSEDEVNGWLVGSLDEVLGDSLGCLVGWQDFGRGTVTWQILKLEWKIKD